MTSVPRPVFVNVGERTNVTGSAAFKKMIMAGDYTRAVEVARQQVHLRRHRHRDHRVLGVVGAVAAAGRR